MGSRLSAKDTVSLDNFVGLPGVSHEKPMSADIIRQGLTNVAAGGINVLPVVQLLKRCFMRHSHKIPETLAAAVICV